MKLKIVGDGTVLGTKVINSETGEVLQNVKSVAWYCDADSYTSLAVIEVRMVELEAEGQERSDL